VINANKNRELVIAKNIAPKGEKKNSIRPIEVSMVGISMSFFLPKGSSLSYGNKFKRSLDCFWDGERTTNEIGVMRV
jgi:hypothetical protein